MRADSIKMVKKKTTKKKKVAKSAAKTKKSSRSEKPKVVAIIACDSIMQQMPSGKPSLIGVFDNIQVANPKKPFRPFSLMTKLYGGKGAFRVGLHIKTPNGVFKEQGSDDEIVCNPGDIHQGAMSIAGLDVSEPGMAMIYVTFDGKRAGNPCPIRIVHVKQEENIKSD